MLSFRLSFSVKNITRIYLINKYSYVKDSYKQYCFFMINRLKSNGKASKLLSNVNCIEYCKLINKYI